ncbi:hypothetical protein N7499_006940 [Penicillium canescens]|uniref:Uncharacterized protein n=1 Tax=Penicillium canescens TaxID=5083 RepID=A0AAD6N9Z7_PENCN|nr:uncharacterized protein N7446_002634 [Penicillium canescens]KAJ6044439.1 hypothetical protein N7460_005794 [Penicillium canescens]KAJ6055909.1 hypothetical protein N7444_005007 [Penicillium canescens]KAJ6074857.1 hypothetical protein N7446_002634 [Penicillium canescens]KAJ6082066.1 hypothetical protein N7499_006940 [Penicillium canescens]KAJ6176137.1 hypothetical protein N7485_003051 [Penicillium canescens]
MSNTFEVRQEGATQSSSIAAASSSSALGMSDSTSPSSTASPTPQNAGSTAPTPTKSAALIPSSLALSSSGTPTRTSSITNIASSSAIPSGSHKPSYSGGTLAGAIVGSIAGTLLLALLAFFCLRHRRKRNHPDAIAQSSISVTTETPKQPAQIQSRIFGGTATTSHDKQTHIAPAIESQLFDLGSYIPSPVDDNTVSTKIQTLYDQASLHIDNYYSYTNLALRLTPDVVACMNKFDSPFLPSPLAILLSNPRSKRAALTHTLVRALLQGIQPGSQTRSLLPPCYTMSRNKQETSGDDFGTLLTSCILVDTELIKSTIDDHRVMFAWRILTSNIYTRGHNPQGPTSAISQREAVAALVEDFATAFAPYFDSHSTVEDHLSHLTSVVQAAADLGAWLFSQPCSFEFRWSPLVTPLNQVIMFPAVLKVGDEQGRPLSVPHTLVEETSARI